MNNTTTYNSNMSFYGNYTHVHQEKEQEAKTARTNKYQWSFIASGYSNASSPGTSSASSVANSQCHGQSPDELSVDTLFSGLIKVVNGNNFSRPSFCVPMHSGYSSNRSKDYIDQARNGSCSSSPFPNSPECEDEYNQIQAATASGSPINNIQHFSSLVLPLFCEIHCDAQRFYCQTCSLPLCGECGIDHHVGHVTVTIVEAVEGAGHQADRVLKEAKLGISALAEELDAVQDAAEKLEQKSRQAISDVISCTRRVAAALEAREQELLDRIERTKALKRSALKARDEGLRHSIIKLSSVVDMLREALESHTMSLNPLNLLRTKDLASAEVFQIRQRRQALPSVEENWISFNSLESSLLASVANLGDIIVNNPGHIGDRRALRGRGSSPQSLSLPMITLPQGRPVSSSQFPVVVRTNRASTRPVIIGDNGDPEDNLCRPWGIACDREGHVVIADRSNNRIQVYHQNGTFIRRFGTHGSGPGQFDRPAGVAVDARRRIIVADKDNHRIQALTMEGIFLLTFGEKGSRYGQFNYPWDVAVNSDCQIAVSDTRNHRVQLFSPEGVFLSKYGYEATPIMWKYFDSPRGVAFNPRGNIMATDFNNHRIVVIDGDFMHAKLFECENKGNPRLFLRPQGLVVDDQGNVIIADSRNHRIQIFDARGCLKLRLGTYGRGENEMDRPSGIALCPDGSLAVVDFGNNRVLII